MTQILHKIKAHLYSNALTNDPDDFIARVNSERSLNVKDICESATARGGADISADAMEHAVNLWLKEMGYRLCDGFSINTGWFMASTHIKGVFNSPDETFNPEKHTVLFEFQQGLQLRRELQSVQIEIMGIADSSLGIAQVTDIKTGSVNDIITPNRNLRISGHKLKIAGDNDSNGVYFVNHDSQERTKVDASDVVINNPAELMIVVPALAAGTYRLEVTTQFSGSSTPLKEPRSAMFDKYLTVR
ncbi:MAG: DUF4469 domain-containing protein [Prevotellaceae bacterium]|jgi:hypothetical protein|nr:DUF4469 domain-containing protein [Prevotellaceae bacterium]